MFAALTSFAVYGERLSALNCLGGLLIVASILVGELRVLPPPPPWLPAWLLPRWARARDAQLADAAAAVARDEAAAVEQVDGEEMALLGPAEEAKESAFAVAVT